MCTDPAFGNSFESMLYLLNLIKCMEGVEEDGLCGGHSHRRSQEHSDGRSLTPLNVSEANNNSVSVYVCVCMMYITHTERKRAEYKMLAIGKPG